MHSYFISTLYSIAFLAILDIFISNSNNGKTVKIIISLISVVILAVPIVNVIKNFTFSEVEIESDFEYSEYLLKLEKNILNNKIESALKSASIEFSSIRLEFLDDENKLLLKKIFIKPKTSVLTGSDEHIDMAERVNLALKNIIELGVCEIEIETQ